MQATTLQEKMNTDYFYSEKETSEDFYKQLKIMDFAANDQDLKLQERKITEDSDEEDEGESEEEEEEEEFSFACAREEDAAEDAFSNGQIKAVFPLFDQSLLFSGGGGGDESDSLHENLPMKPPVKKVFVETKEDRGGEAAASSPENDEIAGPYCEWSSRKAVEVSPPVEACKKSNSTGFSKIWRLKEITSRSNSDGRDAFVFLNGSHAPPPPPAVVEKKEAAAVKAAGVKVKKSGKGKATAAVSAHEVYLRSKAKEEERRRSYRPELVGFFTNINGGLTRNVHPF